MFFVILFAVENMKAWFHTQWNITIWAIVRSKLTFKVFNSSKNLFDLVLLKLQAKQSCAGLVHFDIGCSSRWLGKCLSESLFSVSTCPYTLDFLGTFLAVPIAESIKVFGNIFKILFMIQ